MKNHFFWLLGWLFVSLFHIWWNYWGILQNWVFVPFIWLMNSYLWQTIEWVIFFPKSPCAWCSSVQIILPGQTTSSIIRIIVEDFLFGIVQAKARATALYIRQYREHQFYLLLNVLYALTFIVEDCFINLHNCLLITEPLIFIKFRN